MCLHKSLPACNERTDMSMKGLCPECECLQHDESAEREVMRVSRKTVAIKLCGHCSPRRDMMELAVELKGSAEEVSFEYYSECHCDADILLILNACESACAERPPFDGPVIIVTPETVDRWPVENRLLADTVLRRIR